MSKHAGGIVSLSWSGNGSESPMEDLDEVAGQNEWSGQLSDWMDDVMFWFFKTFGT